MNTIAEYLIYIRLAAIKVDIKITGWRLYTTALFLFLIGLMLENVFYLSTFIRFTTFITIAGILVLFGIWITIIFIQIKNVIST